ncbi:MAG: hypothetical protein Q8M98_00155 [Candidatus Cloacimonadaceae bacterium]|nr:hypothetical protein [Candidatus Cloacimonadaceae bacterium]MDP3113163.1 hypothetical protein [Candidatus Cloacimonadaceae bacterium]
MKKTLLIIIAGMVIAILCASGVGKIRFLLGDVQYRDNQNTTWKKAVIGQNLEMTGMIKTGIDSSVEILWTNNQSTILDAKVSAVTIKKLVQDNQSKQKWTSQVREKASNMNLQSKHGNTQAAGIRREEADLEIQTELFWDIAPRQDIQEAIDLFDLQKYALAIPLFELVVAQGPLKKKAEVARTYLILIYEDQKDVPNRQKQIEALRMDFPNSDILLSLPAQF